jgi:Fe-S-cluster containining protein
VSGPSRLVTLVVADDRIELSAYGPEATVRDLVEEVERYRLAEARLLTARCAGCGRCCDQRIPVFAEDMDRLCGSRDGLADAAARRAFLESALEMPSPPDMDARHTGIRDMVRDMGMSAPEATAIYEFNQAEPIVLRHGEDGKCAFLRDGMCTIYPFRTLTCRLYVCNMGERLSVLQERMVTEGTWHAYQALGWTGDASLDHNAFRAAESAWDLPLGVFEPDADRGDPERLFFYF